MTSGATKKAASNARRYGVLIASSRFPDEPKLKDLACPENDVDGLFELLNDAEIGGFTELLVVKNKPSHDALRGVHKILRKAGRDDIVLIYYAGHGKLDRAGRLHLATIETVTSELESTSIPAQRLRDLIDTSDATKIALILDCCYSGAIEKSFLRGDVEDQLNVVASGRGTFIMTASTDVQTAREEVRDGYGIFTKHLIDGMRGAADSDGNGIVTMNELYDYVHKKVLSESHQVPMKWNLNVEGDMVIARTGRKPREERRLALRDKLFKLAKEDGLLPDGVFTKALEVLNLPYEATRSGGAARYDALLDRLLDENIRLGDFLTDWLKVPPDDGGISAPPPRPSEPPKSEPVQPHRPEIKKTEDEPLEPMLPADWNPQPEAGWFWRFMILPFPATQRNLDRHILYRLTHAEQVRRREAALIAAGIKVRPPWADFLIFILWISGSAAVFGLMIQLFDKNNVSFFHSGPSAIRSDDESGGLTGALIAAATGYLLLKLTSRYTGPYIKALYWFGIAGSLALGGAALVSALQ